MGSLRLTRREFLGLLAGAGLAACVPARRRGSIEGRLVGADLARRAHALREPPPATGSPASERAGVVIVGAGIAGLSAAWRMARAGFDDFVVLELEDVAGGTSQFGSEGVVPHPWGAHYIPVPIRANASLEAVLEEVGAITGLDASGRPVYAEQALVREPEERIFHHGQWHPGLYPRSGASASDLAQLERFTAEMIGWSALHDDAGRPAFAVPRSEGSDGPALRALDAMTMSRWMDSRGFDSPRLRWLVEYGCRDDFGATMTQVSAWAGLHYHASRLGPDGQSAPVLTWPEGNGHLVRHLASVAGARLRTGVLVRDVVPHAGGVDVLAQIGEGGWQAWRAEAVVLATPIHVARHVLAPWREAPPADVKSLQQGAWIVANVHVRERPSARGVAMAWDSVIHASPSLGYVVASHQTGRDHGPTVLTWYRALLDDDPAVSRAGLLERSWESLADEVLDDLAIAHPEIRDITERVDIRLWGHAMVRPTPGLCWSPLLEGMRAPVGERVHLAHADLSALALFEEAHAHGVRAAEAILERLDVR